MFSQEITQGQADFVGSPFVSFEEISSVPEQDTSKKRLSPAEDMFNFITQQEAAKAAAKTAETTKLVVNTITEMVGEVVEAVIGIVKQAVKMAAFKFAIEMCAMGIKSLVEAMLSLSLTPPNIDTKGVFYNVGVAGGSTPAQPAQMNQPRYDNPFGSPFGASPGW